MKKNLPTLTIGIPAYNEEKNIAYAIKSIFSQKISSMSLKSVVVLCDGCTDKTVKIVSTQAKRNKKIHLHTSNHRGGKANGLNRLYRISTADFLLTMDADVIFKSTHDVEIMAQELLKDKKLNMVGPEHWPTKTKTLFGNFSRISALTFGEAVAKYNDGNNFYACMAVEFMRRRFYKSFTFPEGTISDQCYAYGKSIEKDLSGYKLVKEAGVIFGVAQTFNDWRILSVRSTAGDKEDAIKSFGRNILHLYTIPKSILLLSTLKWFFKSPLYTLGSVLMNIYIRVFPYNHKVKNGVWEMVSSSKEVYI